MSGLGPERPPRRSGFGGVQVDDIDCADIKERVTLQSPSPAVVATLRPGDVLRVELAPSSSALHAITSGGEIAGSITGMVMARVGECIRDGYAFVATVRTIKGGLCELDLTSAGHP